MAGTRSGINRGLMWLRRTLQITEETESPQVLSEIVQPSMDVFGWERLGETADFDTSGAAAPANTVNGANPVGAGLLRVVVHASVTHTDTGVQKWLWIDKLFPNATTFVGVSTPLFVDPVVDVAMQGYLFLAPGEILRGRTDVNLVAGALVIDMSFYDLPIGEYIH